MSDKPKVYQGVRVKITVKELLQKRRALQAESRKSQVMQNPDVYATPLTAAHLDSYSVSSAQDAHFQPLQFCDNVHISTEDSFDFQLPMNVMPSENFISSSAMCPNTSAQWAHGYIPSCTDYYSNSLASSSPTHSFNLPSPVDYNSYSPPDSYSSSSSCYNSPTRMDLSCGFAPESYHYQHCSLQHCFCLSHWPSLQDSASNPEHAAYSSADCTYGFGQETYCRRDSTSSELAYL